MEMHQVRYFLAASETLNFTRAAERCNVSQPSLTAAIKKLEAELGGPLFRRERHRSHLTDLGRLMKPHLERIYGSVDAARAEAINYWELDKAPLRLGVMCTIGPSRMVDLFTRLSREIPSIEVTLTEAPGMDLIDRLMAGDMDVAVIGLPDYPERLDATPLYEENYVVAFPSGHRFEAMGRVPFGELEREDYLARLNCEHPRYLEALGRSTGHETSAKFASEREDWIQAMIAAGMGCSVMPDFMPLVPGIATRLLVEPEVSRTISLVTVSGRRFSPTTQILMRLARAGHSRGL
jgi:DNA-binding transcriptional LysR family regulator